MGNTNLNYRSTTEIINEEEISFEDYSKMSVNNSVVNEEDPNVTYDLSWDELMYLASLEETYRLLNPDSTPEDVSSYLTEQLDNLVYGSENTHIPLGSYTGSWKIFGVTLTSAEILLFTTFPIQAVQAYNASKDAISKGEKIYFDFNTDDNNQNSFRHGYWNALMEKRISKTYMQVVSYFPNYIVVPVEKNFPKMFADAHEYGTSGISTEMDYLNNELGRNHGSTFKKLSDHNIAIKMIDEIAMGNFNRIKNNIIVPTNWEGLRPEYLYTTTSFSGGLKITGILYRIDSSLEIPSVINGKNVLSIGDSAFANQTSMVKVLIPSSITHIGKDAFYNTNNASIYLLNRTSVPNTFDINWNYSSNSVYLNGNLCYHSNKMMINLNSREHANLCNACRTIVTKANHRRYISNNWEYCYDCNYSEYIGHSHLYTHDWKNLRQHESSCTCGDIKLRGHIVSSSWNGMGYTTCLDCGGPAELGFVIQGANLYKTNENSLENYILKYFGNGSYILQNGVVVLSDIDLESYFSETLIIPSIENYDNCCKQNLQEEYSIQNLYHIIDRKDEFYEL